MFTHWRNPLQRCICFHRSFRPIKVANQYPEYQKKQMLPYTKAGTRLTHLPLPLPCHHLPALKGDFMPAKDSHTLPLQFEEPCDKIQLAARLTQRVGKDVQLTLTRNRVSMVHFRHEGKLVRIRLHRSMCRMPDEVLDSLAGWVRKPGRGGAPDLVRAYIRSLPAEEQPARPRRSAQLVQRGDVHDLGPIAQRVNQEQFNESVTAGVTWGRDTSRTAVRVRRIGSYHRDSNTITIHPVLDDVRVPEAIVAFTIFHEMLHALQPATQKRHHDKAFHLAEQDHPDYDSVQRWMKKHSRLINGGHGRKLS